MAGVREKMSKTDKKVASVLPKTYGELHSVTAAAYRIKASSPDASFTSIVSKELARQIGTTPRTVEWIRKNGMCLDSIVPRPSTLPHAGQGAIAQHFVPMGDILAPAPMLHIMDRDVLRITASDNVETFQLLLNYCFGHGESSLLLCPITNALLVNHCSTRKGECGKDGPNAEYRWASGWDPTTEKWLELTLDELAQQTRRGLSMEIVATRDIKEGEEVFIDYGREWEDAWDKHVANWKPPVSDSFKSYVSPTELNEKGGPLEMLVSEELSLTVEHPNLFTGCIFWESKFDKNPPHWDSDWEDLDDNTILKRYSTDDGAKYVRDYEDAHDGAYWPCSVIWSENDSGSTYTVRILASEHGSKSWHKNKGPRFVTNYPRESIRYFNKPFKSDQHLSGAFRHHIEIRDDMIPEQWKDRQ